MSGRFDSIRKKLERIHNTITEKKRNRNPDYMDGRIDEVDDLHTLIHLKSISDEVMHLVIDMNSINKIVQDVNRYLKIITNELCTIKKQKGRKR